MPSTTYTTDHNLANNINLLSWFNFLTDFQPYSPIAILYFSSISNSYFLGFSIFSIEMVSTCFFEIPTGILSDLVGRKWTLVLGALAAALATTFYAIGLNFWVLALGSVFGGLARSLFSGNNQALLHDTLKELDQAERYTEHSGDLNAMFQLALAISAFFGGLLASYSYPLVLWLSVLPRALCCLIALRVVEPRAGQREPQSVSAHLLEALDQFSHQAVLRRLTLASVLEYSIGETLFQFNAAVVALVWPSWALGMARTMCNLFSAVGMKTCARITQRYGFVTSLMLSNAFSCAVGLAAGLFPSVLSPVLLASASFSHGIGEIAKDALFQRYCSDAQRATLGSLSSFAGSLSYALFAFAFGYLADQWPPNDAVVFGKALSVLVVLVYWSMRDLPESGAHVKEPCITVL